MQSPGRSDDEGQGFSLPAVDLPSIADSDTSDPSDDDVETPILFSGNAWGTEPSLPLEDAQPSFDLGQRTTFSAPDVPVTTAPPAAGQEHRIYVATQEDTSGGASTSAEQRDTTQGMLPCLLDDSELNGLIERLRLGAITDRGDSIGSRVYNDLPSVEELFSDDELLQPSTSSEQRSNSQTSSTSAGANSTTPETERHEQHPYVRASGTSAPQQPATSVSWGSFFSTPASGSHLQEPTRPTMFIDLRASLDQKRSTAPAPRAWPAMSAELQSCNPAAQATATATSSGTPSAPDTDTDSGDDDSVDSEFDTWMQQRVRRKGAREGGDDLQGQKRVNQQHEAVAFGKSSALPSGFASSMGGMAQAAAPRSSTASAVPVRHMFVSTEQGNNNPSKSNPSLCSHSTTSSTSYRVPSYSDRNLTDTQSFSDKCKTVLSGTQVIHFSQPTDGSSPSSTVPAGQGSRASSRVCAAVQSIGPDEDEDDAVDSENDGSTTASLHPAASTAASAPAPSLAATAHAVSLPAIPGSPTASQDPIADSSTATIPADSHIPNRKIQDVGSIIPSASCAPAPAQAPPTTAEAPPAKVQECNLAGLSYLPVSPQQSPSDGGFTIVASMEHLDTMVVADVLRKFLALQQDPYCAVSAFDVLGVQLVPAKQSSHASTDKKEAAVLLLAAAPKDPEAHSSLVEELQCMCSMDLLLSFLEHAPAQQPGAVTISTVDGWDAFVTSEATPARDAPPGQELVVSIARGSGITSSSGAFQVLQRLVKSGLHLVAIRTIYPTAQECRTISRTSQLHADADALNLVLAACGAPGGCQRWQGEVGPAQPDVARVTDPLSLHSQFEQLGVMLSVSYDAAAASKECSLLFGGPAAAASSSQQQTAPPALPLPDKTSAWLCLQSSDLPRLIHSLLVTCFCATAGHTIARMAMVATLPEGMRFPADAAFKGRPCLLVRFTAHGCTMLLDSIRASLQQAGVLAEVLPCDTAVTEALAGSDPTLVGLESACCPVSVHQAQQPPLPQPADEGAAAPASGVVDVVAIALNSSTPGAALGWLAAMLTDASEQCPLLHVLAIKQEQQVQPSTQQLFTIHQLAASGPAARRTSRDQATPGGPQYIKGPALLALVAGVDLQDFVAQRISNPQNQHSSTPQPSVMGDLGTAQQFQDAANAALCVGLSQNSAAAQKVLWRYFKEGQVYIDPHVHDGQFFPALAADSMQAWSAVQQAVTALSQSAPTVCVLSKEALQHNNLDRLLAMLTKEAFRIVQAATVAPDDQLASAAGVKAGEVVVLLLLERPNAVQRLQQLLSSPGWAGIGATACSSYSNAVAIQQLLAVHQPTSCQDAALAAVGKVQQTCLMVLPTDKDGQQWLAVGRAWHELQADGFNLLGLATTPCTKVLQMQGLSKLPEGCSKRTGAAVVLALGRKNAVTRCAMKLQDAQKASHMQASNSLAAAAAFACCCMTSKAAAQACEQVFKGQLVAM